MAVDNMTADIIELDKFRNPGNGGRDAMTYALLESFDPAATTDAEIENTCDVADVILARLWLLGFKVVPLEQAHEPQPPLYA